MLSSSIVKNMHLFNINVNLLFMNKLHKFILVIAILLVVFFTNFLGHYNQMPMHVDSWQLISKADYFIKQQNIMPDEPFSHTESNYPEGSSLFLAVLASISNWYIVSAGFISISQFLPAILNVILALLLYLLSKTLFKNEMVALAVMAFTPLAISNITMLGIFYLAPVAFGMVLSYLFFSFLVRKELLSAFLIFVSILVTHNSSLAFASVAFFLYFIFNKENWKKLKYLLTVFGIGFFMFILMNGFEYTIKLIPSLFLFEKIQPHFSIYLTLPIIFLVFLSAGIYLILVCEKRVSKFLIPLFAFLAVNAFAYWYFQGILLVYRRLYVFLYSMLPFFIGYSVWFISFRIESLLGNLKKYYPVLIIIFVLLIPQAVMLNIRVYERSYQYVTSTEHELFKEFGEEYPENYLVADHLESFALPYYNIKPVVLSPMHGANTTYYAETFECFANRNITCFEEFFNTTSFEYLYTSTYVNSTHFEPFLKHEDKIIYKFVK